MINSIQQGMAAELDFQAHRRPGRRQAARGVRAPATWRSAWRDEKAEVVHHLYAYEHGVRLYPAPVRRSSRRADANGRCAPARDASLSNRGRWRRIGVEADPGHRRQRCARASCRSSAATGCVGHDRARELRARARLRRGRSAPAARPSPRRWAWRWRTRACSTRRSAARASPRRSSDVGRDLSSTLDLATVMDRIAAPREGAARGRRTAPSSCPRATAPVPRHRGARRDAADEIKATAIEPGRGIIGRPAAERPARVHQRHRGRPARASRSPAPKRARRAPDGGAARGRHGASSGRDGVWRTGGSRSTARDLEFLVGLSQQAAMALHNARLFDETQRVAGAPDGHRRRAEGHQRARWPT